MEGHGIAVLGGPARIVQDFDGQDWPVGDRQHMAVGFEQLSADRLRRIIEVCRDYEESRLSDAPLTIPGLLERLPSADRTDALMELIAIDVELRLADCGEVSLDEYVHQFPEHADLIGSTYAEVLGSVPRAEEHNGKTAGADRLGDFRIVREIGRGGMGLVYEAIQESLQRRVALKVLPKHSLLAGTALQRFEREAKAVARLHHNHIVEIYGTGEQEGVRYFAMQLIDEQGLHRLLERESDDESGMKRSQQTSQISDISRRFASVLSEAGSPSEVVTGEQPQPLADGSLTWSVRLDGGEEHCRFVARIGEQIAGALHYAHGEGILHRDVKPSNIMLDARGKAWLTDFGLAKLMRSEDGESLTEHGDVVARCDIWLRRRCAIERTLGAMSIVWG